MDTKQNQRVRQLFSVRERKGRIHQKIFLGIRDDIIIVTEELQIPTCDMLAGGRNTVTACVNPLFTIHHAETCMMLYFLKKP